MWSQQQAGETGYARRKLPAKNHIYKAKGGLEPVGSANILTTTSHWLSHDLFNHLYILQYKLQFLYWTEIIMFSASYPSHFAACIHPSQEAFIIHWISKW